MNDDGHDEGDPDTERRTERDRISLGEAWVGVGTGEIFAASDVPVAAAAAAPGRAAAASAPASRKVFQKVRERCHVHVCFMMMVSLLRPLPLTPPAAAATLLPAR